MFRTQTGRSLSALALALGMLLSSAPVVTAQQGRCRDLGGGCSATRVPMMRCSRLPNVGCSEFALLLSNLGLTFPSGTVVIGGCRTRAQAVPRPIACTSGCELFVDLPGISLPFQADRFGIAFVPLPVPNDPSLVGERLCAQAARFDPGCLSLTNGIEIRIGRGGCR